MHTYSDRKKDYQKETQNQKPVTVRTLDMTNQQYTTTKIFEQEIYYELYKTKEKVRCVLRTYYGHHKGGVFSYAYKHEIKPQI